MVGVSRESWCSVIYATPTPSRQHFPQCGQMRHVDSRNCKAARRSEISSPAPFSGIDDRNSSIIGFITAALQILRPNTSGARCSIVLASTSSIAFSLPTKGNAANRSEMSQARRGAGQRIYTPQTGGFNQYRPYFVDVSQFSRVPFHQPRAKAPRCCNPVPAAGVHLIRSAPFGGGNFFRQASVKHLKQSHCVGDAA